MQLYVAGCGGFGDDNASLAPLVTVHAVSNGLGLNVVRKHP
jgi:hypothetical protein